MTPAAASPRIAPSNGHGAEVEELLAKTLPSPRGEAFNVFTTLARHPRLLKRFNVLGGFFMTRGELPARGRELVVLRVAWLSGSVYEWGQHVVLARGVGVTDVEIARLAQPVQDHRWKKADAALLAAADQMVATGDVDDAAWTALTDSYSDAQVLELLMLVGFYRMLAGVITAVRVQPDPGLPGWPKPTVGGADEQR